MELLLARSTEAAPAVVLVCRPNLIPTWDLRHAALKVVAFSPEPLLSEQVAQILADPFGRGNEDDLLSVRAALSWLRQKKHVKGVVGPNHRPPVYTVTERGLDLVHGDASPFL